MIEGFPPLVYVGTIKTRDPVKLHSGLSNSVASRLAPQFATQLALQEF